MTQTCNHSSVIEGYAPTADLAWAKHSFRGENQPEQVEEDF